MDSLHTYSIITCNLRIHTHLAYKKRHDSTKGVSKLKNQKGFLLYPSKISHKRQRRAVEMWKIKEHQKDLNVIHVMRPNLVLEEKTFLLMISLVELAIFKKQMTN